MNIFKRFLSLLLVLGILVSVVPVAAFATESDAAEPQSAALTLGTKPEDGTVTGQPFDTTVSKNYRIPGLVNHNGTLIATADARWNWEKDGGGMDLVVSRSDDGSEWNYTFAGYLGDNGNVWNAYSTTLMDPVIISDGETLYLLADLYPAGYSISGGNTANDPSESGSTANEITDTATGFDGDGNLLLSYQGSSSYDYYLKDGKIYAAGATEPTAYTVSGWYDLYENGVYKTNLFFSDSPFQVHATSYISLTTSDDGGETWSAPTLVNVKPEGVKWMVLGPGSGLALADGDIAFTAYDNENIYLIWGNAADGWNQVSTSAATNESSIIELSDGTIRAFVKRAGSNTIAYVDFTWQDGAYVPGGLVDTEVPNFSQCMVSSLLYSGTYQEKDVVLVCCPSKPGSGDWNGRFNGKIHMFTLDGSNNMTLEGSYALNGESDFFAYSNMAELDDGTIGVLYEDDCISYSAGSYYGDASHITYTSVDLETAFGISFDEVVNTDILLDEENETGVEVALTNVDTTGWYLTVIPDQTVDQLTSSVYAAFDVTIHKDDGTLYADSADVTLPLGELADKTRLYPFVVETDGTSTKIADYDLDREYGVITFRVPHFSVVGIAEDIGAYTETKSITILVGATHTITDETGNYKDSYTGAGLNSGIATVTVDGQTGTTETTVSTEKATEVKDGDTFIIRVAGTDYALTSNQGGTTWPTSDGHTRAYESYTGAEADNMWTLEKSGEGYKLKCAEGYLNLGYNAAWIDGTGEVFTVVLDGAVWKISDGTYNIDALGGDVWYWYYCAGGWADSGTRFDLYKVDIDCDASTTITINGVASGSTSVVVGNTRYDITVTSEVREISLYAGQSKTDTIDNAAYTADRVTADPDSAKATLDSVIPTGARLVPVTKNELKSGGQYLIVNTGTDQMLTGQSLTVTGDWKEKTGLALADEYSVDSTALWTITASGSGYTIAYGDSYLNFGGMSAALGSNPVALKMEYTDAGWTILDTVTSTDNGKGYYLNAYTEHNYSGAAYGWGNEGEVNPYWTIYEIDAIGSTEVTFSGVKEGTAEATVGHVIYHITVLPAPVPGDIPGFDNIVGEDKYSDDNTVNTADRSDLDMAGKPVTKLTLTEGVEFDLNVDGTGYDSIKWTVADSSIARVDEDGVVTAVAAGETKVTATVTKDGKVETKTIDVVVKPSLVGEGQTPVDMFYYIEKVDNTTPYYTLFLSSAGTEPVYRLVEAIEGEVIHLQRPDKTAMAMIWTADPYDNHALAKMGSSGSIDEYYPLRDENNRNSLGDGYVDADGDGIYDGSNADGFEGEGQYYYTSAEFSGGGVPNNAYKNVVWVGNDVNNNWRAAVDAMLNDSLALGCDGALSATRWGAGSQWTNGDRVPKLVTAMTFISDPIPTIEKSVRGVLPTTRKTVDYRPYTDGMVASVGELVYFTITITLERPTVWADEAAGIGAITYTNAIVSDTILDGAYFYDQKKDIGSDSHPEHANNGTIDSDEGQQLQTENITERLNREWGANEQTRTIELSLVYQIQEEDIPKFVIDNVADLNTSYRSQYSTGTSAIAADAKASITVVGRSMDNVVIDFGQKVVVENLGDKYLKGVYTNSDFTDGDQKQRHKATYGTVDVEKVGSAYKVTYTPTQILQGPDVVLLYGLGVDEDDNQTEKVINGFIVYPATTVYYEEGFIFGDNTDGWVFVNPDNAGTPAKATKVQTYEPLGKSEYEGDTLTRKISGKVHPYGYDPIYDGSTLGSGNSYAKGEGGAGTTFSFTGTGFELYANSTADSGYVLVTSKGGHSKLYMIHTKLTDLNGNDIKDTTYYSLPVISETDLPYGTYTVQVRQLNGKGPIFIDGVRIINTIVEESLTDRTKSIYYIDKEDAPQFYELRDYVLKAIGVEDLTQSDYISSDDRAGRVKAVREMANMVYDAIGTVAPTDRTAVVIADSYTYGNFNLQQLLDNGPKNELYLSSGQTLVFKVKTNRVVQLGLKSPVGNAVFKITVDGQELDLTGITSTVNMFYPIADRNDDENTEHTVSIKVTEGVLSVTDLKICDDPDFTFSALNQENIEIALLAANGLLTCEHVYGEDGICGVCGESAIVITQQPQNTEAKLGERYCVSVVAEGEGLTYQWYIRNAGAKRFSKSSVKDNTYDDVMTKARAGREVYCVITDANGYAVTTDTVKLICAHSEKLEIITQPTNGEAALGERYCVTVEARGESLKYQWYFRNKGATRWTKSGVTDNTYDDVMTTTRDGREVYCVITDLAGNKVTTNIVKLVRVPMKLEITSQPADGEAAFGERFCVTVTAKGEGLKYQWYYRNANGLIWYKSGVRDNTYDDVMTKARNGREVYCVITDKYGNSVTTDIVKLTAVPAVELKVLSVTYEAAAMGERYCVSVEAEGEGLTYQWYFRKAGATRWSKSGVHDNTYDDVMNKTRAGREVYCVITDAFGNQVSTEIVTLELRK